LAQIVRIVNGFVHCPQAIELALAQVGGLGWGSRHTYGSPLVALCAPAPLLLVVATDYVLWLPSLPTPWRQRPSNVSKFLLVSVRVLDSAMKAVAKAASASCFSQHALCNDYAKNARVEHD